MDFVRSATADIGTRSRRPVSRAAGGLRFGLVLSAIIALMAITAMLVPFAILAHFQASTIIAPGVRVGDLPAERLTREQLTAQLDEWWNHADRLAAVDTADVSRTWEISPSEVGLSIDAAATASEAMQVGRSPSFVGSIRDLFYAARDSATVAPIVRFDAVQARRGLENLKRSIDLPGRDASLELAQGSVQARAAQDGRALDVDATLAFLAVDPSAVMLTYGVVPLVTHPLPPRVRDASAAASQAEAWLASAVELEAYDPVTDEHLRWAPDRGQIAQWLRVTEADDHIEVSIDPSRLSAYIEGLKASLGPDRGFDAAQASSALLAGLQREPSAVLQIRYQPTPYTARGGETLQTIGWQLGMPLWKMDEYNAGVTHGPLAPGQVIALPPKDAMLSMPVVPDKRIVISITQQHLWTYQGGQLWADFVISTGIASSPTMAGLFQVQSHIENAYGSRWNLWMPNFLGIYDALPGFTNGIHGLPLLSNGVRLWGDVLGRPASFGCIILDLPAAQKIYDWAEDGVVVEIQR